jgi:hypothetical protein
VDLLAEQGTRLVAVDNVHVILTANGVARRNTLDAFRFLMIAGNVPLVVAGLDVAEDIFSDDVELAFRSIILRMPLWEPGEPSQRLIRALARGMGLIEPERLVEPEYAQQIWAASNGVTGNFKRILHWSAKSRAGMIVWSLSMTTLPKLCGCFRRIAWNDNRARELEPLAFRVRPLQNECFDSWLHRLVARHDTTRKALFIHLGGDPRLASYDLARGKAGVPAHLHAAFDRLIAQLGWAVEIEPEMVVATFVSLPTHWLLPPALRRFGCAACWREALAQNKPLCVSKEWILCASWWCHDHGLPLSFMPESDAGSRSDASVRKLAKLEVAARELARSIRPTKRLIAANKDAMTFLLEGDDGMFPRRQRAYFECRSPTAFICRVCGSS